MTAVAAVPHFDRTEANRAAIPRLVWRDAPWWGGVTALVVTLVLGLTVVPWIAAVIVGVLVGAGVAVARTTVLRNAATAGLTQILGGTELDPEEHPRLANLLEGLCVKTGVVEPSVRVLDDAGANLAVFGPPDGAVLVITRGAIDALSRVELEGLLAEALWRIRTSDAELAGLAATFRAGSAVRAKGPAAPSGWERRQPAIAALFGEHRHLLADQGAVSVTRYPPGLARALEAMERTGTAVTSATWGTAHLWLCPPLTGDPGAEVPAVTGFPATGVRVQLLDEL